MMLMNDEDQKSKILVKIVPRKMLPCALVSKCRKGFVSSQLISGTKWITLLSLVKIIPQKLFLSNFQNFDRISSMMMRNDEDRKSEC